MENSIIIFPETAKKPFINEQKYGLHLLLNDKKSLPEILFITSYPPRECGIATYSQDLIKALNNKFNHSFIISICPLESANEQHNYNEEIK